MNFFSLLVCLGLIAIAVACGAFLAWLEEKAEEEDAKRNDFR